MYQSAARTISNWGQLPELEIFG